MKEVGESSIDGRLTTMENMLLKVILIHCITHGIEVSAHTMLYMYTQD